MKKYSILSIMLCIALLQSLVSINSKFSINEDNTEHTAQSEFEIMARKPVCRS